MAETGKDGVWGIWMWYWHVFVCFLKAHDKTDFK